MNKLILTLIFITVACFTYAAGQQVLEKPKTESAVLSYVVDGDTIRIKGGQYVRLIGINSPELKSDSEREKCQAYNSKEQLLTILKGKEFKLEADSTQANKDKYGRLLRYVYISGESASINLVMVAHGHAYEYTYSKPYKYQKEFKEAQKSAEENKLGLWSDICK